MLESNYWTYILPSHTRSLQTLDAYLVQFCSASKTNCSQPAIFQYLAETGAPSVPSSETQR